MFVFHIIIIIRQIKSGNNNVETGLITNIVSDPIPYNIVIYLKWSLYCNSCAVYKDEGSFVG